MFAVTTPRKPIKLALLMQEASGIHLASWMHPGAVRGAANSIEYYAKVARTAERALFDLFFVADTPAARTRNLEAWSRYPLFMNTLEPLTLLSCLAASTSRIGLGGTASTSTSEPYNIARQFGTLDHISAGRAAWNVVTSANAYVAPNFGQDTLPPHAERYERAGEFVEIVQALWDTYEDDALLEDRASGLYFDPARFHPLDHRGKHFSVRGALNLARSPQGQPVIIQAGASDIGRDFAARVAEVVFGTASDLNEAKAFYDDLKGRMAKYGRHPDEMKILCGRGVMLGATGAEAAAKFEALQALVHPTVGKFFLGNDLEVDLSDLPLDEPIPPERIPASAQFHAAYFAQIVDLIRKENPTLRQLYQRYERGRATFEGTAQEMVDDMEAWMDAGAADGFMMTFNQLPGDLDDFVDQVIPEMQRRGRYRTEYEGTTLREHLGLARPANRYAAG
jgi:FMN-dependent oxidoreductase (nitrilotriacetate monooxygenase family)